MRRMTGRIRYSLDIPYKLKEGREEECKWKSNKKNDTNMEKCALKIVYSLETQFKPLISSISFLDKYNSRSNVHELKLHILVKPRLSKFRDVTVSQS